MEVESANTQRNRQENQIINNRGIPEQSEYRAKESMAYRASSS